MSMKTGSELIKGDNDRVIGHACRKCGMLYTTKHYQGDHEQRASTCCQEKPCPECNRTLERYHTLCLKCQSAKRHAQFSSKPESEWDGKYPVTLFDGDKYFFHEEELADYLCDIESKEDYPEIEACDEMVNRNFSISEHVEWDDDFGDIPDENEIDDYVNAWIKKNVPPRYQGNGQRVTGQVMKSLNLQSQESHP